MTPYDILCGEIIYQNNTMCNVYIQYTCQWICNKYIYIYEVFVRSSYQYKGSLELFTSLSLELDSVGKFLAKKSDLAWPWQAKSSKSSAIVTVSETLPLLAVRWCRTRASIAQHPAEALAEFEWGRESERKRLHDGKGLRLKMVEDGWRDFYMDLYGFIHVPQQICLVVEYYMSIMSIMNQPSE